MATHDIQASDDSVRSNSLSESTNERSSTPTRGLLQKPNNKNGKPGRKDCVFAVWALEIFVLLVAIGVLIAIVIILHNYNYQQVPDWGHTINLNALIAVLSTIFRASIAFIAFEIISQLKWNWVSACMRPMRDLQRFDDASRGVYGSLRLVPLVFLRQPLTLVAIFIASISLATGPFMQQTIQTYQCLLDVKNASLEAASIVAAHRIDSDLWQQNTRGSFLNYKTQLAMQDSIVSPSFSSNTASLFKCGTGYCKFPTYQNEGENDRDSISHASAGMCSQCDDTSELVEGPVKGMGGYEYRLPIPITSLNNNTYPKLSVDSSGDRGFDFLGFATTEDLTWAESALSNELLVNSRWSVANFSIMTMSQLPCENKYNNFTCPFNPRPLGCETENLGYVAATCILYPCLKYYRAVVKEGRLSETVVRDVPLRRQVPNEQEGTVRESIRRGWEWKAVQQPCMVNGTLYTSGNMSKAPLESSEAVLALNKNYLSEILNETEGYSNITAPHECVFTLRQPYLTAIFIQFWNQFNSRCSIRRSSGQYRRCIGGSQVEEYPFLNGLTNNCHTSTDTIRTIASSIALRFTKEMRLAAWGPSYDNKTGTSVQGQMLANEICIEIVWGWLALPAALCAVCTILLLWILINGLRQKSPVWKSSVLPFLLKGQPGIGELRLNGIEKAADQHQLQLCNNTGDEIFKIRRKEDES